MVLIGMGLGCQSREPTSVTRSRPHDTDCFSAISNCGMLNDTQNSQFSQRESSKEKSTTTSSFLEGCELGSYKSRRGGLKSVEFIINIMFSKITGAFMTLDFDKKNYTNALKTENMVFIDGTFSIIIFVFFLPLLGFSLVEFLLTKWMIYYGVFCLIMIILAIFLSS